MLKNSDCEWTAFLGKLKCMKSGNVKCIHVVNSS